jgi:fumarate hydratase class II
MSQSTNDTFPTAIHITALQYLADLLKTLKKLHLALRAKSEEFADVVKTARTHLMDAIPITLGEEFSGYAQQVENSIRRLEEATDHMYEIPLGGTAIGSGLNTPDGYRELVVEKLAELVSLPLRLPKNNFEAQSSRDAIVYFSGALRSAAISLFKISNDLRLMASGPTSGFAEIKLEALQPGSSIMPGKVNPVECEALCMACVQVMGNDYVISFAGSQSNFELNVMLPIIGKNLIEAIKILSGCTEYFTERAVKNIKANRRKCALYANSSPSLATVLSPIIGYEKASMLAKTAIDLGQTILDVALSDDEIVGKIGQKELRELLDPLKLTHRVRATEQARKE